MLVTALYLIYDVMKDQTGLVVNIKEMIIHLITFGLYLLSVFIYTFSWELIKANGVWLTVNLIWIIFFFISQMMLAYILN